MAPLVKNLPVMQETPVQSLGQEDLLEKGMATYSSILSLREKGKATRSSILAWRIPWTEEPGRLQAIVGQSPWGHKELDMSEQLKHKNAGVGSHSLLQEIFLTQGSNSGLLHCRQILYFLVEHARAGDARASRNGSVRVGIFDRETSHVGKLEPRCARRADLELVGVRARRFLRNGHVFVTFAYGKAERIRLRREMLRRIGAQSDGAVEHAFRRIRLGARDDERVAGRGHGAGGFGSLHTPGP